MKKTLLLCLVLGILNFLHAQTTITLRLNPNSEDALVDGLTSKSSSNFGNQPDYAAWAWTAGGATTARSLMKFNLSTIPANATITSAYLTLKCNTTSAITQLHSGANACYLERITSNWSESSVTWNNQPTTTTAARVSLAASTSSTQNYDSINVASLIQAMVANPNSSYGMMLKLQTEATYRSMVFASGDHLDSNLRPTLRITYTIPAKSLTLTSPNGGEQWVNSGTKNITWTSNNIDSVALYYSANNGNTWTSIISAYPSTGSYTWNIPTTYSSAYRVKVEAIHDTLVDSSDATFTIYAPIPKALTLTAPNGGQQWANSGTQNITWTSTNIDSVALYYSANNGSSWTTIVSSYLSSGSYTWSVPTTTGNSYRIKVAAIHDTLTDISDSVFTIYSPCTGFSLVLKPNSSQGKDALIDNMPGRSTVNYGTSQDFGAWAWTASSNVTIARNLIDFNLSALPAGAIINQAYLSLKCNTISSVSQLHSGANASYIERITSSWTESGVTWNTQPTTNTTNRVSLPATTSTTQNFPTINITDLVLDARNNPSSSFGFMLKLQNEATYRSLVFASSDHPDSTLWPSLTICYSMPSKWLALTSPNGGEQWVNSGTRNITWNSIGVDSVALYYSTNNGGSWSSITSTYPSTGSYVWNVPSTVSSNYLVKVEALHDTLVDISDSVFTIHAPIPNSLILTAPNGGQNWLNSGVKNITWTSTGIDSVALYYSSNNGGSWTTITAAYPSTGTYTWNVPSTTSTLYRVKVAALHDTLMDISDSTFTIYGPKALTLTSPNGGQNWLSSGTQNITWNSTSIDSVALFYSTNNGGTWTSIIAAYPSTGSYSWNVPSTTSNNYTIKVAAIHDTLVDSSDAAFTVYSACTTQSLTLKPNSTQGKDALIDNLSGRAGLNYGNTQDFGAWAWTVGSNQTIARNLIDFDLSGIPAGAIINKAYLSLKCNIVSSVTQLHSGANASYIERITSAWTESGVTWNNQPTTTNTNRVALPATALSTQNSPYIDISNLVIDARQNPTTSFGYMLKLQNEVIYRSLVFASSDHPDSTLWPSLTICYSMPSKWLELTAPNGGEYWLNSGTQNITWNSIGIDSVALYYSANGGGTWTPIIAAYPSTGSYTWNIPSTAGTKYRVKVEALHDTLSDVSNSMFTIYAPVPNSLTLTSPNGGQNWINSGTQSITWNSTGIDSVALYYSANNGSSWTTIVNRYPSSGVYTWAVPATASNLYRVKVAAIHDTLVDISDSVFTIYDPCIGQSFVLRPNSTQGKDALIDNLSGRAGLNYGNTQDFGAWAWTVGSNQTIARNLIDFDLSGIPAGAIINKAYLSLKCNTVSGVTQLHSGANASYIERITSAWTESGVTWNNQPTTTTANRVALAATTSSTQNFLNIDITALVSDARTNPTTSFGYMLKLQNEATYRSLVFASSDHTDSTLWPELYICYSLPPKELVLTSPNGGEQWEQTSTQNITWNSSGLDSVVLSYSTDNGTNWTTIAAAYPSTGSFSWNVPATASTNCRIKVEALHDTLVDISNAVFTIYARTLSLTSPNGGEDWKEGSTHQITWSSSGIDSVSIHYSTNGGWAWNTIQESVPSTGSYTWTIPTGSASPACLIKILGKPGTALVDESDSLFTISTNTGIAEFGADQIKIYPNPANDQLYLDFGSLGTRSIKLYQMNGALLFSQTVHGQTSRIDLNTLNIGDGIYLIEVSTPDMTLQRKFAVIRQ